MTRVTKRGWILFSVVSLIVAAIVAFGMILATEEAAPGDAKVPTVKIDSADGTLPVGSSLPSGQYCTDYANRMGSSHEVMPENEDANHSVPEDLRLPPWPDFWNPMANQLFVPRIDGQYTGTTDQIIVWGACKWGISSDVVRAMAVAESSWRQAKVGDEVDDPALCVGGYTVPCPTSFGLLQLKHTTRPGSWPNSLLHTAFNVDYSLAVLRGCFEGWVSYLRDDYSPGDLSGCVGWHYSGKWQDEGAREYAHRVQRWLNKRPWDEW
jgi:autotransporter family porin